MAAIQRTAATRSDRRMLLLCRQREDVQREAFLRRIDFRRERIRHQPWAAAASAGRYRDILLAVDAVRHREALHRCRELRFPEDLARLHIDGSEHLVAIADERDAARSCDNTREERSALLDLPDFLQRSHVVSGKLADVAVASRTLVKRT